MADVRRSWEDLGFSCDPTTGVWAEIRASGRPTWEDLGFSQDRVTGRWVESGVRAGGHHFNVHQPRDPGGEGGGRWVAGPGSGVDDIIADPLTLADRIELGSGERFRGSGRVPDGHGDSAAVAARVDGPEGPRLRLGTVVDEDSGRWRAANKGSTVELDEHGTRRLREVLAGTVEAGKASVKDYADKARAAHAANLPPDDARWPEPEVDIASGVIPARWGDVHWALTREYGGGPDVATAPAVRWTLSLRTGEVVDFDIDSPRRVRALENAIALLMDSE